MPKIKTICSITKRSSPLPQPTLIQNKNSLMPSHPTATRSYCDNTNRSSSNPSGDLRIL